MTPEPLPYDPSVVVVDDEPDVRLLLKIQLPAYGINVIGEAADGEEAVEVCRLLRPDVVILDLLMPRLSGFEAIPLLREACPGMEIIAYSAVAADHVRDEMASLGVTMRLKSGDPEPLATAIRAMAEGR